MVGSVSHLPLVVEQRRVEHTRVGRWLLHLSKHGRYRSERHQADVEAFWDHANAVEANEDELNTVLHNLLAVSSRAVARETSKIGRVFNGLLGEDPNYVEATGARVSQVLKIMEQEVQGLHSRKIYRLRRDLAERCLERLGTEEGRS